MQLRPNHLIAVVAVAGVLVVGGGPSGIAGHATDAWNAFHDKVDGPVPATVAIPVPVSDAGHQLTASSDALLNDALRRIDGACTQAQQLRGDQTAKTQVLAGLDQPMSVLATLYDDDPAGRSRTGDLRQALLDSADKIELSCDDSDRADMLHRAIARGDRDR
ncbi:hypothetical protein PAI11_13540 [Patulibacter medicamentivorans]|uniref:Uncharacterized protein n=1 Tax=Patulibacter medicamentivorans TaxID=1097667 RepID=H0E3I2_9ACTN|nr:hypothetical protein [Patulibacter medicamentivorans]EHN11762.1 hypothetical protein PAI11_13540 [Patulibacter medicamentivorans]